jgi:hypothetical protein
MEELSILLICCLLRRLPYEKCNTEKDMEMEEISILLTCVLGRSVQHFLGPNGHAWTWLSTISNLSKFSIQEMLMGR